ncbi:MAG: transcriptional repressor [Calditrichaceae bacterium]|nr:transcriptional repressor [Calditrichaceae bacterium]MBN2708215.1 transcriptional repressor [Calditrichaceae bacterium]RQV92239.1 MAG: transcriptional repressor [Calditrichota bacterium]
MRYPWWQHRLYKAGYRLTNPRQVVINILKNTDKHLSAEDIYVDSLKINSSIGLTTVYRTLDLFQQIGIVQKFDFGEGKARYELIKNPIKKEHHHHIICVKCKEIVDYTDFLNEELELINKTEKALSEKYQFKILHHTVHFYGMCSKCQAT